MKARFGAALLLAALAGCATPPPKRSVQRLPTPPTWSAAGRTNGFAEGAWWRDLGSPKLAAAVEEALRRNHDLKAAWARLDAAAAQARIAGASLYPQLGFSADARRQQQVFVGLPIPGREGSALKSLSSSHGINFNVSWELDVWGRVRAAKRAAAADFQAAQEDYRAAMASLAAQTAKAWIAAVEARKQLELAQATAAIFERTARQVRRRYERGLRGALDLRTALHNAESARATVAARRAARDAALRRLETLLGRYPGGTLPLEEDLPRGLKPIPAGLPSELLGRRPDVAAAERRLAAALERVKEAKRAFLPSISLTATGGRASSRLEDLVKDEVTIWALAGNLAQPLFQGGRLRANLSLNRANARQALERYLSTALTAFREVEAALAAEEFFAEQEAALARAAAQARRAEQLAEDRYLRGLEPFLTLTDAQRSLYNLESQCLAARRQRLENRIDLCLALGAGVPEMERTALAAKGKE